jgi:hypothetical protein
VGFAVVVVAVDVAEVVPVVVMVVDGDVTSQSKSPAAYRVIISLVASAVDWQPAKLFTAAKMNVPNSQPNECAVAGNCVCSSKSVDSATAVLAHVEDCSTGIFPWSEELLQLNPLEVPDDPCSAASVDSHEPRISDSKSALCSQSVRPWFTAVKWKRPETKTHSILPKCRVVTVVDTVVVSELVTLDVALDVPELVAEEVAVVETVKVADDDCVLVAVLVAEVARVEVADDVAVLATVDVAELDTDDVALDVTVLVADVEADVVSVLETDVVAEVVAVVVAEVVAVLPMVDVAVELAEDVAENDCVDDWLEVWVLVALDVALLDRLDVIVDDMLVVTVVVCVVVGDVTSHVNVPLA